MPVRNHPNIVIVSEETLVRGAIPYRMQDGSLAYEVVNEVMLPPRGTVPLRRIQGSIAPPVAHPIAHVPLDELPSNDYGQVWKDEYGDILDLHIVARQAVNFILEYRQRWDKESPRPTYERLMTLIRSRDGESGSMEEEEFMGELKEQLEGLQCIQLNDSLAEHFHNLGMTGIGHNVAAIQGSHHQTCRRIDSLLGSIEHNIPEPNDYYSGFKAEIIAHIKVIRKCVDRSFNVLSSQAEYIISRSDDFATQAGRDVSIVDERAWTYETTINARVGTFIITLLKMMDGRRGPEEYRIYVPHTIVIDVEGVPTSINTGVYRPLAHPEDEDTLFEFSTFAMYRISLEPESTPTEDMLKLRSQFMNKSNGKWINDQMSQDGRINTYMPKRHLVAFKNGVYNALEDNFIPWLDMTTPPQNVGHFIDAMMPMELFRANAYPFPTKRGVPRAGEIIPQYLTADDVHDGPFGDDDDDFDYDSPPPPILPRQGAQATVANDQSRLRDMAFPIRGQPIADDRPDVIIERVENKDWFENAFSARVSTYRKIFECQQYGPAEMIAYAGLQGRMFTGIATKATRAGTYEFNMADRSFTAPNWQVASNIVGTGGTGKSKLLEVTAWMAPDDKCGLLESKEEQIFGRDELLQKKVWVVILDEFEPDTNLSRTFLKKGITGQKQKAPRKYSIHPLRGAINAPFAIASNFTTIFSRDDAGAFSRRQVIFPFMHFIDASKSDPDIEGKLLAELPVLVVLFSRSVSMMMRLAAHGSIWSILPTSLISARDEGMAESNPAFEFIKSNLPDTLIRDTQGARGEDWFTYTHGPRGSFADYYMGPYMTRKELDDEYATWCQKGKIRPHTVQWEMVLARFKCIVKRTRLRRPHVQGMESSRSQYQIPYVFGIGWNRPGLIQRLKKNNPSHGEETFSDIGVEHIHGDRQQGMLPGNQGFHPPQSRQNDTGAGIGFSNNVQC